MLESQLVEESPNVGSASALSQYTYEFYRSCSLCKQICLTCSDYLCHLQEVRVARVADQVLLLQFQVAEQSAVGSEP